MAKREFHIQNRATGEGHPCFIIAELSANHNQQLDLALRTVEAAAKSGADAIKLQTYTADTITLNSDKEYFQIRQGTLWDGTTLHKLYQQAYTPWEWHERIFQEAANCGLICFSSPFDPTAVDFLESLNAPAYKIASFEITDTPLIEYAARKGKPMIISTGIGERWDIERAVNACTLAGNHQLALLQCTSAYPAPLEEANLLMIPQLVKDFNAISGLSDHTMGHFVALGAVALGASILEKHFILDRNLGGPDAAFSMQPGEWRIMVDAIRDMEKARGDGSYTLTPKAASGRHFSRSLFVVADIRQGETFTLQNVRSIRPGTGMHPMFLTQVLGKKATQDIERGEPLRGNMISGFQEE